ncbi:fumarate reductase flavoprotein subunit precursor [Denitrovibrio acetiphilus DSM 12809]|uniref:Fumarate reductase flavoprotein subunit n=1 Tax=Denitrovibrio acetiphilus (strain DSM 12809 / NBRC 114555 / N2460) TaxID=522772 RepID=D4H527_DENA2|nr:cytochrome c3 family protein [Denitrovibrio acetiphilus]ADD69383.1 fumarate reductase flavoprotein subunit precursor [Denitrovibrio acetiphilus DSM 12809]
MQSIRNLISLFLFILIVLYAGAVIAGGELRGAHKDADVQCADCHGTDSPSESAKMPACLECHGSYQELAEATADVEEANPHDSHMGELDCGSCHGIHKESHLFCNEECHNFDMVVK